jgi:hypothetical protein
LSKKNETIVEEQIVERSTCFAFGQAIFDYNDQMKILWELHFPLNQTSFRKQNLLKLPKLNILYIDV